jgi:manganese oxidase
MHSFPGVQNRFCATFATAFAVVLAMFASHTPSVAQTTTLCKKIVYADIVALEQAYEINRFSAFVPAGMLYALRDDVVGLDEKEASAGNAKLRPGKRPRPIVLRVNEGDCLQVKFTNFLSETTVEANEDLISKAHNGLPNARVSVDMPRTREASFHIAGLELAPITQEECPIGTACGGDGSNVGKQNLIFHPATPKAIQDGFKYGSLAAPNQTVVSRWIAGRDGAYFAYSMGAPIGGEGDGGQIGLGLFGAVNVEPAGSRWYRSQVTHDELRCAAGYATADNCFGSDIEEGTTRHPYAQINYERQFNNGLRSDMPLLNLLDDGNNIVHSDLNAIIVPPEKSADECKTRAFGNNCGKPFREFTVIFHDEVHAKQAFNELEDENNPLSLLKDGMGINYGVSSMGSLLMSTPAFKKDIYPAKNCPECRAEEFFLSSWANGDPALILNYDDAGKPIGARYPDDPSNVHHSYLGDNVRFRNIHAGPKETHVFHLHAHQWVPDSADPNSSYLDSQTISPGATFSYDIEFGGSGNRNYTPGDSIFHCHLYPHFAQGMWELWRSHDAFTDGQKGLWSAENPRNQNLPDPEIATGTETPALVPIPNAALAPMPSAEFPGYPHYIPGKTGHRPPQPVLDFDIDTGKVTSLLNEPDGKYIRDGGLPRHVLKDNGKTGADAIKSIVETARDPDVAIAAKVKAHAIEKGGVAAQVIAERVSTQNSISVEALAGEWKTAELEMLNWSGTPSEDRAMKFHEGRLEKLGVPLKDGRLQPVDVKPGEGPLPDLWNPKAYLTDFASTVAQQTQHTSDPLFYVNGADRAQGAPYANPCPEEAPVRDYRAAFIQTELTYNKHGWFDPQGRIAILENDIKDIIDADSRTKLPAPLFFRANSGECINFKSSNFVPSALNADDFQLYTPTDTIGQHIHLVKFDVTSSDGSGNGFNYEDATFSPEEVIERIFAYNRTIPFAQKEKRLLPKEHPLFQKGGDIYEAAHDAQGNELTGEGSQSAVALWHKGLCPDNAVILTDDQQAIDDYQDSIREQHPYCGAQRTTQRWWADPILNTVNGHDNTLRTVFTHDHMGPSSHQQHGLYAGLVIEPANSVWTKIGPVADSGKTGSDVEILQQLMPNVAACSNTSASPPAWCKSLIGGSDLNQRSSDAVLNSKLLASIAPRPPLKLRDDGGPTHTMANIYAPECIGDSDSNPLQPQAIRSRFNNPGVRTPCPLEKLTHDTRREFALAIADFGIAYNTLLEPINPEPLGDSTIRDTSLIRFGQRHVMDTPARPLAISSEDPGSQYFNYRHEPLALRISDATPDKKRSGWNYRQSNRRAILDVACKEGDANCVIQSTEVKCSSGQKDCVKPMTCDYERGDQDCLGDTANGFSTGFHARRDERLLLDPLISLANGEKLSDYASGATRQMTSPAKLDDVLAKVEQWRVNFNCALYAEELTGNLKAPVGQNLCSKKLERAEPWRQFGDPATPILPAYEGDRAQIRLIQGAQEAQHIFTMNGVKWHRLPGNGNAGEGNNSGYTNAQPVGISEHFEFDIVATPLDNKLTDYMYFGSSTDQIWDGLWGVMRVFSPPQADIAAEEQNVSLITSSSVASGGPEQVNFKPKSFLSELPGRIPSQLGSDRTDPCTTRYSVQTQNLPHRFFEVSAVRVCDLYGTCKSSRLTGVTYNSRFGIADEGAVAFVLNKNPAICYNGGDKATDCGQLKQNWDTTPNSKALSDLRAEFGTGKVTDRKLEPLVLRAAAGQCINVHLRNLITPMLPDGPAVDAKGNTMPPAESESYYNFLPMITDGFNINDFQMSSSVGLSPTRVAMHVTNADGSNVGLNGAVASLDGDIEEPAYAETSKIIKYKRQGSLIPPCVTGGSDKTCKIDYMWSATDFEGVGSAFNRPLELGAIPLRSFGDPMKHAGHGLIGALVVGPSGSKVCEDDRYFAERKKVNPHAYREGVSAEICKSDGSRYVDHVLIVQDSVFAKHGGFPIPNLAGAEEPDDYGVKGINYKTNPLWARTSNDPSMGFSERNDQDMRAMLKDEPEGLVFTAKSAEEVRLNIVHSGGHTRQQGMAVSGHAWNPYPWSANSHVLNANAGSSIRQGIYNGFGPMMGITLPLQAGGLGGVPMDYLIRSQASFLFDGGIWAVLRVEK